jgi:hypothetical protein
VITGAAHRWVKNNGQTTITGGCFEQTTRDISLTSVDGTHFSNVSMRVARHGSHVTIRHRVAIDDAPPRLVASRMVADCQKPRLAYGWNVSGRQ